MTSLLPSVWDLLLPNFSVLTVIGIIVLIIGLIGLFFIPFVKRISAILIFAGLLIIWGFSILEDFIASQLGVVIFWGVVAVVIIAILLFWEPKQKGGKK